MSILIKIIAKSVQRFCRSRAKQFRHALAHPAVTQKNVLKKIISASAATEYGARYKLKKDDTLGRFRLKIPIVYYNDLKTRIEKQIKTQAKVITADEVKCYELTSGSTSAVKHIPYNRPLLNSFQNMFKIWAYDLLTNILCLRTGKIFMSISPQFRSEKNGLQNDSDYLPTWLQSIARRFSVVPDSIRRLSKPQDYRDVLACLLLAEAKLEIISIWNASFLLILFEHIATEYPKFISDLRRGQITRAGITFTFKPLSPQRLSLLEQLPIRWSQIWPNLQFISCWDAAAAKHAAQQLQRLFPQVLLQGKGLLATEAPITVPQSFAVQPLPLIDEIFFEFLADDGSLHLIHELKDGQCYSLIITVPNGLLRYRLGDQVQVCGFYKNTPMLKFLGRNNQSIDLVGEKLNVNFVRQELENLLAKENYSLLLPVVATPAYYLLLTNSQDKIADVVEAALQKSYHYRQARQLQQLKQVKVIRHPKIAQFVHDFYQQRGIPLGAIKDQWLITDVKLSHALLRYLHSKLLSTKKSTTHSMPG